MHKLFIAIICLASFVAAQTSSSSSQHSAMGGGAQKAEPTAIIETTDGNINCTLFPDKAPIAVANFIGLATGTKEWTNPKNGQKMKGVPLYNGTIFHRVIPEFMIQGGDPLGTGSGDPGYKFKNEVSPDLTFNQPGRLAYANAGPDTNGSQFFITEVPYPSLNGGYTIFGQCQDLDVVKKIARLPRNSNDRPNNPPTIKTIKIIEPGHAAAGTAHNSSNGMKKSSSSQ